MSSSVASRCAAAAAMVAVTAPAVVPAPGAAAYVDAHRWATVGAGLIDGGIAAGIDAEIDGDLRRRRCGRGERE